MSSKYVYANETIIPPYTIIYGLALMTNLTPLYNYLWTSPHDKPDTPIQLFMDSPFNMTNLTRQYNYLWTSTYDKPDTPIQLFMD